MTAYYRQKTQLTGEICDDFSVNGSNYELTTESLTINKYKYIINTVEGC